MSHYTSKKGKWLISQSTVAITMNYEEMSEQNVSLFYKCEIIKEWEREQ